MAFLALDAQTAIPSSHLGLILTAPSGPTPSQAVFQLQILPRAAFLASERNYWQHCFVCFKNHRALGGHQRRRWLQRDDSGGLKGAKFRQLNCFVVGRP